MDSPRQKYIRIGCSEYEVVYIRFGDSYLPAFILVNDCPYNDEQLAFYLNIGDTSYHVEYLNFNGSYVPSYTKNKHRLDPTVRSRVEIGLTMYDVVRIIFRGVKFPVYLEISSSSHAPYGLSFGSTKISYTSEDGRVMPVYTVDDKKINATIPKIPEGLEQHMNFLIQTMVPPPVTEAQRLAAISMSSLVPAAGGSELKTLSSLRASEQYNIEGNPFALEEISGPPPKQPVASSSRVVATPMLYPLVGGPPAPQQQPITHEALPTNTMWFFKAAGEWIGYGAENSKILTNAYNKQLPRTTITTDNGMKYEVHLRDPFAQNPVGQAARLRAVAYLRDNEYITG